MSGDANAEKEGTSERAPVARSLAASLDEIGRHSLTEQQEALETLLIYVNNLLQFPQDPRYRRIKINNIHFQERLGHMPVCADVMAAIGFHQDGNFYVYTDVDKLTDEERVQELKSFEDAINARLKITREEFMRLPFRHEMEHQYKAVLGVGCHNEIGKRQTNEDDEIIVDQFCGDPNTVFLGLYDGHGGRQTVDFVVRALHMDLERMLNADPTLSPEEAMRKCYLKTDGHVRRGNILQSGTTAATVILRREADNRLMLYCANVGDSRVVVSRNGKAIRLTIDHKPNLDEEKKRITEAGGFVGQGNRVNGVLAISRAIGDHSLKSRDVVTANPTTNRLQITNDDKYVILACDGLWDELTDQQAVDFMHERLRELDADASLSLNEKLTRVSQALVTEALQKGSTDNVTVMVAALPPV